MLVCLVLLRAGKSGLGFAVISKRRGSPFDSIYVYRHRNVDWAIMLIVVVVVVVVVVVLVFPNGYVHMWWEDYMLAALVIATSGVGRSITLVSGGSGVWCYSDTGVWKIDMRMRSISIAQTLDVVGWTSTLEIRYVYLTWERCSPINSLNSQGSLLFTHMSVWNVGRTLTAVVHG